MSGGVKSGRTNQLYYNDKPDTATGGSGTYLDPVWVLIDRIGDLDQTNEKVSAEIDIRASSTVLASYGNKSYGITFVYYKREGANDGSFNVLLKSFENSEALDIMLAEEFPGTEFVRRNYTVADMAKAEPVAGVDVFDVEMSAAGKSRFTVDTTAYTSDSTALTVDAA